MAHKIRLVDPNCSNCRGTGILVAMAISYARVDTDFRTGNCECVTWLDPDELKVPDGATTVGI